MISKVSVSNLNTRPQKESLVDSKMGEQKQVSSSNPQFTGLLDLPLRLIQACEQNPMVNVTVLDLSTAIVPRTIIESQTNAYAGFEAFRREGSGLVVNCLLPGFVVMGMAKLLNPFFAGKNSSLANSWAGTQTIDIVKDYYTKFNGDHKKIFGALIDDLSGLDGNVEKSFKNVLSDASKQSIIDDLAKSVKEIKPKEFLNGALKKLAEETHITEHVKLKGRNGFLNTSSNSLLRDTSKLLREMDKAGVDTATKAAEYLKNANKMVYAKGLAGLALIIPLAVSMQSINRWITAKQSGVKGAPIYEDYAANKNVKLEKTPEQKKDLLKQKVISIATMCGVGLLSTMKKPSMQLLRDIVEFRGKFPTMDQARFISTLTFASRMAASEDANELRESRVRDIATFASFYFMGDYAAKAAASLIEKFKPNVKLLNRSVVSKQTDNALVKFKNWLLNTHLKSSEEVLANAKNLRSVCQLANIGVSLIFLGLLIPKLTRAKTKKNHEKEKALQANINENTYKLFIRTPEKYNAFQTFLGRDIHDYQPSTTK